MAESCCDRTSMLRPEDTSCTMRSDDPLIGNRERKRQWMSHYVFTDFAISPHLADGRLVLICEKKKSTSLSPKKTIFVLAILLAFIVGFTLGAVVPLYLVPRHTYLSVNAKEPGDTTNQTFNEFSADALSINGNSFLFGRLVDGIFWNEHVESSLPAGFGDEDDRRWKDFVQKTPIVRLEKGCGRMQNRLVTFEDGTKACGRYRQNTDQIQGEIFSYYLGRLLGLRNLVPSTLVVINSSTPQWTMVRNQLESSHWAEDRPVVLTKYIEDLLPAQIPLSLKYFTGDLLALGKGNGLFTKTSDPSSKSNKLGPKKSLEVLEWIKSEHDLVEMVQWSDLIIFDYLTANLDRVVNNLYNLQWNPDMLSSPAHNLARTPTTSSGSDLLVFLDNESGLLHGYRLLGKYEPYHRLLLDALCVFRKSTVEALSTLNLLNSTLSPQDVLPSLPDKNVDILRQRVARVLRQVVSCAANQRVKL